jgi:DNA-binding CsgD family transcriptional regulator
MRSLSESETALFLDCIRELQSFSDLPTVRSWLLETALPKLVPSDWFSYNEVDLVNPANTLAILKPDSDAFFQNLFPRFRKLAHQHPLITRQLRSPNFPVHKISDFLGQQDYHRLELYQEVYRHLGVEYQIAATIKLEPDRVTAFALSRRQRDYDERDRVVLEMLRPHLVVAFNHLALAGEWQNLRENAALALHELSSATIIVNPLGRILYHVGPGLRWIGAADGGCLPAGLTDWVRRQPQFSSHRSTCLATCAGEVHIRAVPTTNRERILLVLTLKEDHAFGSAVSAVNLTPREHEVAQWISEGKTNAQIATILGISPRTVHKHVEHIFERLGVESRVALTVRLLETPPAGNGMSQMTR